MEKQNVFNNCGQDISDMLSADTKKGKDTISEKELNNVVKEENLANIQHLASGFLTEGVKYLPEIRERMKAMGLEGQLDTVLQGLGVVKETEMNKK
ncbi:hypothetical protein [Bacillus sp. NPDC094106]|uniref:hypothetical protein n=1 Tax=Bacillus sp. NPDC094106 TaxID=3363949 RepID=UPI003829054A